MKSTFAVKQPKQKLPPRDCRKVPQSAKVDRFNLIAQRFKWKRWRRFWMGVADFQFGIESEIPLCCVIAFSYRTIVGKTFGQALATNCIRYKGHDNWVHCRRCRKKLHDLAYDEQCRENNKELAEVKKGKWGREPMTRKQIQEYQQKMKQHQQAV